MGDLPLVWGGDSLMVSISNAASRDDVYDLTELAFANRSDPVKLAKIADALEESIPCLDPARFRHELEHVLAGPDLPQLAVAKEMARAVLEGRPVPVSAGSAGSKGAREGRGFLGRATGLLRGRPGRPKG